MGYGSEELVVGYFGFMNRSKGIETLIHSIARLVRRDHPAHLLIIGGRTGTSDATNAAYADEIDALIRDTNLEARVRRTGFVTPEAVTAALLGIDLCALPYRDGASLWRGTLHAALAHGCAVVTTAPNPPIPELQDGETAALVPPEDPEALAQAIVALRADPARRAALQRGAAALAQQFTWPHIAAETAAFFAEVRGSEGARERESDKAKKRVSEKAGRRKSG
jgi:glycosyltransferase involved in cell wall biosynthesis